MMEKRSKSEKMSGREQICVHKDGCDLFVLIDCTYEKRFYWLELEPNIVPDA